MIIGSILIFIITVLISVLIDSIILKEYKIKERIMDLKNNKIFVMENCIIIFISIGLYSLLKNTREFYLYYFMILILYKVSVIDIKTKLVNRKLLLLLVIVSLWFPFVMGINIMNSLITSIVSFFVLFGVSKATKGGFGMGDAKIIGILGFALGYEGLLGVLLVSSFAVFLFSIGLLIKSRRNRTIPFVPFLLLALVTLIYLNN
ncbi:A24 family peptidase [Clostridium sp. LY3-2]|uniref:prepilin peptidase n=1 Tax=Clostridium sp. LY3-2 TaxID=2942482 RepID=UPI0021539D0C|nr:A24 family peptidase [Clostridium sp. LY3-2]MCR6515228.1 A24 family peptidase [Clostridium sp. LY3-2]